MILPVLFLFFAPAQAETAGSVMARVAINQDRAETARSAFVYHQNVLVRMNHTNGKLAHEEASEYTVTPTPHGITRQRTSFTGKYVSHGKVIEYHDLNHDHGNEHVTIEIDGAVCTDVADSFVEESKSKDGIARDLFPLTAREQRKYLFHLDGTEDYRGTPVYRVTFEPKPGPRDEDADDVPWAGEALIERNEFQPVLVTTHLAAKIPLVVRTLLGTNLEHMGFKVTYKKFDEGLWFPVSYGGELKVRALFFYKRRIGVSVQNSGFQHADVSTTVSFAPVQ